MPYDAGSLARLFEVNFAPSFHYQLPNPYGLRTGTELQPIGQSAGVLANIRTVGPAGGIPVYYSNGFASAGAGQTSSGGGLLSAITGGLETILPAIFGGGGGKTIQGINGPVTVPATRPSGGVLQRTMGGITKTAQQHPVLTAAGGAAATVAGAALGRHVMRGRVAQLPDGTLVHMRRHRRMNPCNIRALRRGLRRAHAFERIARKVLHFTNPRKSHGVAHFKRARKRS